MAASKPDPIFFENAIQFREWLDAHHLSAKEVYVGYRKVSSGLPSMTWSESVDEALCFGWIDGVRNSLSGSSYMIRFTPRKVGSNWSAVNIAKVDILLKEDRMRPAGMKAWEARKEERSGVYSYENKPSELPETYMELFRANAGALAWFEGQAKSYTKAAMLWVLSAKQEETRLKRLATLIEDSASKIRIKQLQLRKGKTD